MVLFNPFALNGICTMARVCFFEFVKVWRSRNLHLKLKLIKSEVTSNEILVFSTVNHWVSGIYCQMAI